MQEKYLQQKNLTKKDHLKMIVGNVPAFIYFWISGLELIPANIFFISVKPTLKNEIHRNPASFVKLS